MNGIITPMITPLLSDDTIDKKGLKQIVEHLIAGGINGIFVLGTTGEATSLPDKLKQELIALSSEYIGGRVPLFVGITDPSPGESIALAAFSKNAGASAVVAAPPFYFTLTQPELMAYYNNLADKSVLPVFIYNMPAQTKIMIEPSTVTALSKHPNIPGIKDSSGIGPYFNTLLYLLKDNPDFSVFVGPDEMMAQAVLLGGSGGVNSGSNMFPHLFVRLYKAAAEGDLQTVRYLQQAVMEISSVIYSQGGGGYRFLKGIKKVLSAMKMTGNTMALPLHHAFKDEESDAIRKSVDRVKQILSNNTRI
ncbi:MAG: dihydrodipicolinate synthase family protein [Chitinophagaceae bacterium]|nr:dihydrodipicolinate synthase family protein [Chitinophagaceae bacterium]MCW5927205.1 dihydrodipicolinate synthase family protein [Chitinophagaceae bacterium]